MMKSKALARKVLTAAVASAIVANGMSIIESPSVALAETTPVSISGSWTPATAGAVTLGGDVTSDSTIEITADTTIDLAGHSIAVATGNAFSIAAGAKLTITDSAGRKGVVSSPEGIARIADTGAVEILGGIFAGSAATPFEVPTGAAANIAIRYGVFPTEWAAAIGGHTSNDGTPRVVVAPMGSTQGEVLSVAAINTATTVIYEGGYDAFEMISSRCFAAALTQILNSECPQFVAGPAGVAAARSAITGGTARVEVAVSALNDTAAKTTLDTHFAAQLTAGKTVESYFKISARLLDSSGAELGEFVPGAYASIVGSTTISVNQPTDGATLSDMSLASYDGLACTDAIPVTEGPGLYMMTANGGLMLGSGTIVANRSSASGSGGSQAAPSVVYVSGPCGHASEIAGYKEQIAGLKKELAEAMEASSSSTAARTVRLGTVSKSVKLGRSKKKTEKVVQVKLLSGSEKSVSCGLKEGARNSKRILVGKNGIAKLKKGTKRGSYAATVVLTPTSSAGTASSSIEIRVKFVVK